MQVIFEYLPFLMTNQRNPERKKVAIDSDNHFFAFNRKDKTGKPIPEGKSCQNYNEFRAFHRMYKDEARVFVN